MGCVRLEEPINLLRAAIEQYVDVELVSADLFGKALALLGREP